MFNLFKTVQIVTKHPSPTDELLDAVINSINLNPEAWEMRGYSEVILELKGIKVFQKEMWRSNRVFGLHSEVEIWLSDEQQEKLNACVNDFLEQMSLKNELKMKLDRQEEQIRMEKRSEKALQTFLKR